MTMATMGVTAVPRLRGVRPLAGLFPPVCSRVPPLDTGCACTRRGRGQTRKTGKPATDSRRLFCGADTHTFAIRRAPVRARRACESWPHCHIYCVSLRLLCYEG